MSTTVIRKACARFTGFVLLAVTPFRRMRGVRFFSPFFRKIGPGGKNGSKSNVLGTWRPLFWRPKFFGFFGIFNLPQHSLMLRSGHLRNPGFPFFIGRRDPSSALCNPPPGSRHPISGVRDCRLRIPDSAIYIYLLVLPSNRPCGRYVQRISFALTPNID